MNNNLRVLTHSEMNCFRSCQRRHKYRYRDLRRPNVQKSDALVLGSAVHSYLEELWKHGNVNLPFDAQDYAEAKTLAMVEGYAERYPHVTDAEVVAVEKEFRIPLINPESGKASRTWMLGGKIDAIVRKNGRLYIVEHKTSGSDISPGSQYWQRLRLDSQISIYMLAVEELYGEKCYGCLYDVLGKPRTKPREATPPEKRKYKADGTLYKNQSEVDESPESYLNRLRLAIAEKPDEHYQRAVIKRSDEDMVDAQFDLWNTAKLMRQSELDSRWPKNSQSCFQWYSACDYFPVCCGDQDINNDLYFTTAEHRHPELGLLIDEKVKEVKEVFGG